MPRYSVHIIFALLFIFFTALNGLSQNSRIDSMENDLKHPKDDTAKITLLYNLSLEYYAYDTVKGMQYLERGYALAKKMNFLFQIANYYEMHAKLLISQNRSDVTPLLDTAIVYYEKNAARKISAADIQQSKLSIATCQSQKGLIMVGRGKYKEAISLYLSAMEAWKASDEIGKNEAIANYYGSISTIYFELNQPEKALEYDVAAIPYRLLDKNDEMLAMSYLYVSDDLVLLSRLDSAMYYIEKARPLTEKVNTSKLNYHFFSRMGKICRNKKEYDKSVVYYLKALKEATIRGDQHNIGQVGRFIAECYYQSGKPDSARKYLLAALPVISSGNYLKEKLEILKDLVQVEDTSKHIAAAYGYLKQVEALNDSLKTNESKTAVAEIENKYQAAQKEKEILQLEKDKEIQSLSIKQQSTLNYILVGSLAAVLLLGVLLYRNYRQKQLLQQQKIIELEKDRQLMAVDAMLKGQEEERSRLAKDLHDGLGGMLSGVKYSLNNMKDNLIVTPDNMAVFERSLDMIDTSIKELRRVAHNMMPEMLTKFGLNEALKEYCNNVNATQLLKVKYQSFGMDNRLDSSVEIIIYRVVQELLNNILKHAGASETLVQLIREGGRLNILVEDNGKGFDTALLEQSKGAGWTNIQSRVDYLKGRLDIQSEIGMGTSVTIELNV